jgi:hypothetical protein
LSLFLIVVWMTVAPVPIMPLHSAVLPVVLTIALVLIVEVTLVGAVFAVVPVMVVTVVPIADTDVHVRFLRLGTGHDYSWRGMSSSQE